MAYVVMAYVVMAHVRSDGTFKKKALVVGMPRLVLAAAAVRRKTGHDYSYGLYSYGLYSYGRAQENRALL